MVYIKMSFIFYVEYKSIFWLFINVWFFKSLLLLEKNIEGVRKKIRLL